MWGVFYLYRYFSSQDLLIVLIIFLQQVRCVQLVRAFLLAGAAFQTTFNLFHLSLHVRCQPGFGRCSAQHEGHARALVDHDTRRTRHTVSTAAAEFSGQLRPLLLDERFQLII